MRIHYWKISLVLFFCNQPACCQVRLPQLLRDSRVVQRGVKVKMWGWASPNEEIKIVFRKKKYATFADVKGNWMVMLTPLKAGGPDNMTIDGSNHIILHDILVGDVWVCSGQSNMVHQMELHTSSYSKEIAAADYPAIRLIAGTRHGGLTTSSK